MKTVEYESKFILGKQIATCTFTVVLTGKELNIESVNIKCKPKIKKTSRVEDFVHHIGPRIRIILSFLVKGYRVIVQSSAVEIVPCPLENIEDKLDAVFDIVEDIHEAVQDCSGNGKEEEQGKMIKTQDAEKESSV